MGKKDKIKIKTGKEVSEQQEEVVRLLKFLIVIILMIVGIYFFTKAFITKDLFKKAEEAAPISGVINYDTTIIGQIFDKPEDEYYVVLYDAKKDSAIYYATIIKAYQESEKPLRIYFADLDNQVFNKQYYTENADEINANTTDLSKFKVGDLTLLKIKSGKITKVVQSEETFVSELTPK